jgi:hypothetical protein
MKAKYSSEMLLDFQRTTRRYIPEDRTFHNHWCENLKSYTFFCSIMIHIKSHLLVSPYTLVSVDCLTYDTSIMWVFGLPCVSLIHINSFYWTILLLSKWFFVLWQIWEKLEIYNFYEDLHDD